MKSEFIRGGFDSHQRVRHWRRSTRTSSEYFEPEEHALMEREGRRAEEEEWLFGVPLWEPL
jgi:hypothetical protein